MNRYLFRKVVSTLAVLAFVVLIGSCTRYHVVKGVEGSDGYTEVSVWSNRSFDAPDLDYIREGSNIKFRFGAETINQQASPFEIIGGMAVQRLIDSMLPPPAQGRDDDDRP